MADFNGFKKNGETYIPNDATARASISMIEGKIPSAASSSNKLVDTTTMNTAFAGKQDAFTVPGIPIGFVEIDDELLLTVVTDRKPTKNSNALLESGTIYDAIDDVYKANGMLGAKNRCPVPDKTETSRSVTYVMVNKTGIVTANGTVDAGKTSYGNIYTRSDSPLILPPNRYKMKCDFIAQTGVSVTFLCTRNGESYTYGSVNSSNDIIEADVLEGDTIGVGIVCLSGTVLDNKTFAPMIWLASDSDNTFVPSAMTNRELTELASPVGMCNSISDMTSALKYAYQGKTVFGSSTLAGIITNNTITLSCKLTVFWDGSNNYDWYGMFGDTKFAFGRVKNGAYQSHKEVSTVS